METVNPNTPAYIDSLRRKDIATGVSMILRALDCDVDNDENFIGTPDRVARAFMELCDAQIHSDKLGDLCNVSFPSEKYSGMIVQTGITAIGLCPHHLLPVEYTVNFGYIPNPEGGVIGLSKIPRVIKFLCSAPILQEELTNHIVETFCQKINPLGVAVVLTGRHSCMRVRGVKEDSPTTTSKLHGLFLTNTDARNEFLQLSLHSNR